VPELNDGLLCNQEGGRKGNDGLLRNQVGVAGRILRIRKDYRQVRMGLRVPELNDGLLRNQEGGRKCDAFASSRRLAGQDELLKQLS
jgi:hypothetical protein